jgi:hypothetical protein
VEELLSPLQHRFPPVAERDDAVQHLIVMIRNSFGRGFRGFRGHAETLQQYPENSPHPRMVHMDEEQPKGSEILEKCWALAGLLAAAALAWMAIDLLIPRKPAQADDDAAN